jgi:hypothetical protein
MNEQRKSYLDYMNPNTSKHKQDMTDLAGQIRGLLSGPNLSKDERITLAKMLALVNKQKYNLSKKVARSVQSQLDYIQKRHQR